MKKRMLSLALVLVMLLGLLPTVALAVDEAHSHDGWTAVTMGGSYIKLDGEEQRSNTLPSGCYYLDADVNVTLIVDGEVELCLNGHSVTVSSDTAVKVYSGASLTLWDCAAGSAGKIAYTGTGTNHYGIDNNGTLTLRGGGVEGAYRGVCNRSTGVFTMTGGSVKGINAASGYGVWNNDNNSVFRLSGGSVSGGKYGIYNYYSGSQVYLSGAPSITGGTADIYTGDSSSNIYADDGVGENAVPYSGAPVKLAYSSYRSGKTAVHHVTEATKDKFTLAGLISDNYELKFSEADNALQIMGKPQALTWYGIDGEDGGALTGDGYPDSIPYNTHFESTGLPTAPAVEGKLFLGWLYKKSDDSDWSTDYCSDYFYIRSATAFKADYLDNFSGGGSGAAEDPYRLATAADLQKLAALVGKGIAVCNNSGVYYQLTDNIDLSTVCGEELGSWTPIGRGEDTSNPFEANFDGNGRTISNLYINTDRSYQGLFYSLNGATVKSLTLTGSMAARGDLNALAGYIDDDTVVENVDVTGVLLAPYGYTLGEGRRMAYMIDGEENTTIHVQSNYRNNWVQTTFSRNGYKVETTDNLKGAVTAKAEFINGGRYVQFNYTVTAGETAIADGKLAVHADIQIGDNDDAAVETVRDADGQVIGLKMVDTHTTAEWPDCTSRDAQFNLYFGGTGGVTPVDTYWFGWYGDRDRRDSTYGYIYFAPLNESTESSSGTYEQADGVYTRFSDKDSGFALSWQNIDLAPGESRTYSFILSVGEKAEPPQWSDENAVTLTLSADAAQSRRLVNVRAKVKDAAGLTDTLYYSVDGGEGEILGEVAADGSVKTIPGQLDLSGYAEGVYLFSFWVVNSKGAASSAVEREITITPDGVEGMGETKAEVEVKPGAPAVTVDEETLKDLAGEVQRGESVTVKLTVEKLDAPADKAELEEAIQGEKDDVLYLDLSLLKTTVREESVPITEDITDTGERVLEIAVPYDFTGKKDVTVYRKHGENSVEALAALSERPNRDFADGSFFADNENGVVYIYASKFSTYAIGYTAEGSVDPGPVPAEGSDNYYTITATAGEGGSISPKGKVSVRQGLRKSFTVTPGEGYEIADVLVDGESVGAVESYVFQQVSRRHTIEAVFRETEAGAPECPRDNTCPISKFTDADPKAWYHDGVHYCLEKGLMVGVGDGLFAPETVTSRAMIAAILWRMEGSPEAKTALSFPDCEAGSWYTQAVAWGTETGVVKGYDSGDFGPEDPITREQLAVMLYRYAQTKGQGFVGSWMFRLDFADAAEVSPWASEAVHWCVMNQILTGKQGDRLDPLGLASRAEAAAMLQRFCQQ